jgi:hypothetical protein
MIAANMTATMLSKTVPPTYSRRLCLGFGGVGANSSKEPNVGVPLAISSLLLGRCKFLSPQFQQIL